MAVLETDITYRPHKTGTTVFKQNGSVTFITFPGLDKFDEITAAFSTRTGGVSSGFLGAMNLGLSDKDNWENILRNYKIFANAVNLPLENFVISDQQHTDNIKIVCGKDRGKGLFKPRDYRAVDGFITNEQNVVLCLLFADCVPIYLYDYNRRVISLVHSGWKGTALRIASKAIFMMGENYGSKPEDIVAQIAPSICGNCYEVSGVLYDSFSESFGKNDMKKIFCLKQNGKYMLDLWLSNRIILEEAGVPPENIYVTDLCTCCNHEILFSHRYSEGKRGNLAAVFMLN